MGEYIQGVRNQRKERRERREARRKAKTAASSRSSTRSGPSLSEQLNEVTDRENNNSTIGQMEAAARGMYSSAKASYNRCSNASDADLNKVIRGEYDRFDKYADGKLNGRK